MPLVNIRLARRDVPTTAAQKAALIAGVTQLMQQVLDKRPESVTVIIDEVDLQNLFEVFSGSHWSAIGMSGCFGCAAWAHAHASSRGVQSPDFAPTLRAVVFAGGSAALRRLWIAELSTAHRALHPIPERDLCDPENASNRFS